jgi:hypothetical protein
VANVDIVLSRFEAPSWRRVPAAGLHLARTCAKSGLKGSFFSSLFFTDTYAKSFKQLKIQYFFRDSTYILAKDFYLTIHSRLKENETRGTKERERESEREREIQTKREREEQNIKGT